MAYYFIFPEKDTTLYSHPDRINMNTGGDEILELVEEKATTGNTYYASRILIKFKNTEIKDVIENKLSKIIDDNHAKVSLNLYAGENKNLTQGHIIEAFPLSQSFQLLHPNVTLNHQNHQQKKQSKLVFLFFLKPIMHLQPDQLNT